MSQRALLLAIMEPALAMEEEFNDWYDLEHLPQMQAIPGIDTALRFVAVDGWPRYLAVYDLKEFAVLRSTTYRLITGSGFTPWSRRILSRVKGWQRLTFKQESPGDAIIDEDCRALLVFVFKGRPDLRPAARSFSGEPGVTQVRCFGPGEETNDGAALLVEAGAVGALPRPSGSNLASMLGLVFSAAYVRYSRTDPVAKFHALEKSE
ncbi:MAG: hypothetical protein E6I27_10005 [Chloroflexi bacterium]|nr:MAG: hypothetical protein E6I27_10005 [Chloroflexota bacterium]